MKFNIDWSKAPEWAYAYAQIIYSHETTAKDFAWICKDGYRVAVQPDYHDECWPYTQDSFTADRFRIVEFKPGISQWSGEGLPPVGTVCEWAGCTYAAEEPKEPDLHVGDQVKIIAHFKDGEFELAAFTFNPQIHNADRGTAWVNQGAFGCFRPICTPERIAAEERQRAIEGLGEFLSENCNVPTPYLWEAAQKIYDAGYRKQAKE